MKLETGKRATGRVPNCYLNYQEVVGDAMAQGLQGVKGNMDSYKWIVVVKSGFMAGTHRFKTLKRAEEFIERWKRTPGNITSYDDLPVPTLAKEST